MRTRLVRLSDPADGPYLPLARMKGKVAMCQATVYLAQDDQEEEIMRDVILLEPVEGGLRLQAFFEEPVTIRAQVSRVDFLKHTVTLVPKEEG
jgi:predicted RNA-binding protein